MDLGISLPFRSSFPNLRLQLRLHEREISRREARNYGIVVGEHFAFGDQPNRQGRECAHDHPAHTGYTDNPVEQITQPTSDSLSRR